MEKIQLSLEVELTEAKTQFVKDVTGKSDIQEAYEIFTSACIMSLIDPMEILNEVEKNNV